MFSASYSAIVLVIAASSRLIVVKMFIGGLVCSFVDFFELVAQSGILDVEAPKLGRMFKSFKHTELR